MTKSCKNDGVSGGIRPPRHSRESGNLKTQRCKIYQKQLKPNGLDSRLRGNDGILVTVATACATAKGLQQTVATACVGMTDNGLQTASLACR
ncbi:TPA: hypothetical protein ACM249_000977 [Neisseria meningitidis]